MASQMVESNSDKLVLVGAFSEVEKAPGNLKSDSCWSPQSQYRARVNSIH